MKQPLQPKTQHPIAQICLDLKEMGYDPIPLPEGKFPPYRGYVTMTNTEAEIKTWTGKTAAIRMAGCPDLVCIDLDIKNAILVNKVLARWYDVCPQFMDACLRRNSGGASLALFGRAKLDFAYASSNHWVLPGGADDDGHRVEIFTPLLKARYIAVWGVHTKGTDRKYRFEDAAMWEMKLTDLPELTRDDLYKMLDVVDAVMAEEGLQQSATRQLRKGGTVQQYDLRPDMTVRLSDDTEVKLRDIKNDCRAYATLFDDHVTRGDRLSISILPDGTLQVWDSHTDINHYFERVMPEGLAEGLLAIKQAADAAPPETPLFTAPTPQHLLPEDAPPEPGNEFKDRVAWLLNNYGYFDQTDKIVALYAEGENCSIPFNALNKRYANWFEIEIGPRGGKDKITAAQCWMVDDKRINLDGIQLRPDQPFPVFIENGRYYKNTYRRPQHEGYGDIAPWDAFMTHLLPEPEERAWFLNWLAHKWMHPEVPGVAVVMVAASASGPIYGAGRGILCDIIERLLGQRYVRHADFDLLTGKSGQSVYTGWYSSSLLITVSEAKDDPESGRWSHQRATYERLKEIIEPRAKMKYFHHKYGLAGDAKQHTSFFIASNNDDAVQIPADDRRIAVLHNGGKMPPEMARALSAWMELPGNIAVLARALEARDLSTFDVYTPLHTKTKARMQEMALTEFDTWKLAVRDKLGRGALFTSGDLKSMLLAEAGRQRPQHMDQFNWMVSRWVRAVTDLVAGRDKKWRMSAQDGGEEIRQWTDYEGPAVGTVEAARARVLSQRKQRPVGVADATLGTAKPPP